MLSKVYSSTIIGIDGYPIACEVDISNTGFPAYFLVGLPDNAVKESRERITSAIKNSGFYFPSNSRITINLAPADIKKEGSMYDLPIAVGIMLGNEVLSSKIDLETTFFLGELSLDGTLRAIKGALPICISMKQKGFKNVVLPIDNAQEASAVNGLNVYAYNDLKSVIKFIKQEETKCFINDNTIEDNNIYDIDFSEIKGQENAKRALEIAASGGHNILMIGPPGSGKTMLAKRLPTILPKLTFDESLEATKIHSVSGNLKNRNGGLLWQRPFRSPHHTISDVALIGGGSNPKPGEVSLAHNGVLFLDELPEFKRTVLEVLRQPLEDRVVTISRAMASISYPSNFMLVAAMNPCPCGYFGDKAHKCSCSIFQIQRYRNKISGPLMDRIDLHIEVPAVNIEKLSNIEKGEDSNTIKERVEKVRAIQKERFKNLKGVHTNSQMQPAQIEKFCKLDNQTSNILKDSIKKFGFSARAYHRILKVARTIADMENSLDIKLNHVLEAIQYRALDKSI